MSPQLIARDLFQSFRMGSRRIEVLRGISIEVAPGEIIFICGASGAGKTTLLYTLAGLERPESGTVEFEGRNLYNGPAAAGARSAELAGGEQQRVAIARALTNDPDIIFADEPTGNLDSATGRAIVDLLLNLARERKKSLLIVTHDTGLATRGDRELHIKDGRLE